MLEKYNYKDLSVKAKEKAYQSTLEFYDYAIKEMLKNTVYDKDGGRIGCKGMKDIMI